MHDKPYFVLSDYSLVKPMTKFTVFKDLTDCLHMVVKLLLSS